MTDSRFEYFPNRRRAMQILQGLLGTRRWPETAFEDACCALEASSKRISRALSGVKAIWHSNLRIDKPRYIDAVLEFGFPQEITRKGLQRLRLPPTLGLSQYRGAN
jgi:hypothetical protein